MGNGSELADEERMRASRALLYLRWYSRCEMAPMNPSKSVMPSGKKRRKKKIKDAAASFRLPPLADVYVRVSGIGIYRQGAINTWEPLVVVVVVSVGTQPPTKPNEVDGALGLAVAVAVAVANRRRSL